MRRQFWIRWNDFDDEYNLNIGDDQHDLDHIYDFDHEHDIDDEHDVDNIYDVYDQHDFNHIDDKHDINDGRITSARRDPLYG